MRRLLLLAAVAAALVAPAAALAHPLGNFTVNRYSGIELSGNRIYLTYVLDMAEIPTFQEHQGVKDNAAFGAALTERIRRNLALTVGGQRVSLRRLDHALAFPPGVAGLRTLRLQVVYASDPLPKGATPVALRFRDANFARRIGWKEIVVRARDGGRIVSSSAPSESVSSELLAYPKDLLRSPLEVTSAEASVRLGSTAGPPPSLLSSGELEQRVAVRDSADGGFAALIAEDELTTRFVLFSLLVALFWGAAHAFSPGHGKAIVAGYLVGSRGTPRHAVLLGVIVTVTHTIGVFALGLITLALSAFIVPEQLYPWLNLVSALLVVGVGLAILRWRFRAWRGTDGHGHGHHHHHDHAHGHHDHHHGHVHTGDRRPMRGLLGIGISAGIIPCPTALVVLLAAISLQRVGYGLILIVAFSVGLAAAITSIGLIAVTAKRAFSRMSFEGPIVRALPAISALVVIGLGLVMTLRSLPGVT
jgi:nickel/cobalt transporter (NicO) family protein